MNSSICVQKLVTYYWLNNNVHHKIQDVWNQKYVNGATFKLKVKYQEAAHGCKRPGPMPLQLHAYSGAASN